MNHNQQWLPFHLFLELEEYYFSQSPDFAKFSQAEFTAIHGAFEYFETENGQRKLLTLFKSLPREATIQRAYTIYKLCSLLTRIRNNRRR